MIKRYYIDDNNMFHSDKGEVCLYEDVKKLVKAYEKMIDELNKKIDDTMDEDLKLIRKYKKLKAKFDQVIDDLGQN